MTDPEPTLRDLLAEQISAEQAGALERALLEVQSLRGGHATPGELAKSLARTLEHDAPLEAAWLALAVPGLAAPSAVALLEQLARNDFDALEVPEGSVGEALSRGWLHGLEATEGSATLRIDGVVPHYTLRGERGRTAWALSLQSPAGSRRILEETPLPFGLLRRRCDPSWRSRVLLALQSSLAENPEHPEWSLDSVVAALAPDGPCGLAGWLLSRGAELLARGGSPLVAVTAGADRYELSSLALRDQPATGSLRWELRLTISRDGQLTDVMEQELTFAGLDAELHDRPSPEDETLAVAALEAWRRGVEQRLLELVRQHADVQLTPMNLDLLCPVALMALWIEEGPPGDRPPDAAPRLRVDAGAVARAAAALRAVGSAELDELRASIDESLVAGFVLEEWSIWLCPDCRLEGFAEDRIYLTPPGGEPLAVAMNDPWNGHVMPIDGDAEVFRAVARFLREVLTSAGLDVSFERRPRGADEDEAMETLTLTSWLRFPHPDGAYTSFPEIDWRVQATPPEDFIAPFSFWEDGPFEMPRRERDRYRRGIGTHYHRFVRDVIDPSFGGS